MSYPNLVKEMEKSGVNDMKLSKALKIPYMTVRDRTRGKYSFTFEQAMFINKTFFPDKEAEYLFSVKEEV